MSPPVISGFLFQCSIYIAHICVMRTHKQAGEMPQRLRGLATLPEDPGSVPRTYMATYNCPCLQSQGHLNTSSYLLGHCMHVVHAQANTHVHTIKLKLNLYKNHIDIALDMKRF